MSNDTGGLADLLDELAGEAETTAVDVHGVLPEREHVHDAPLAHWSRAQWREAGVASTLREVARTLRSGELPVLRTLTWLVARQVECDCAVDEAMERLTVARGIERESAIAWSAYVMGRAKGIRIAAERTRRHHPVT